MAHITLTDNSIANPPSIPAVLKHDTPPEQAIHIFQDLQQVSGKSLGELCKESENLLVFPHCLGVHDDGLQELSVCELVGRSCYDQANSLLHVNEVKIKTGNVMGFIGFSGKGSWGTQLEIRSRFTDNSKEDFFLHYLLERVFKINLFNLEYSFTQVPGLDFLYLLFPYFLKKALGQGVFRSYQTFEKNDSAVCGTVNISRHLRQNQPFKGSVAYRSREYSYDNSMTQLIRHTIECIRRKEIGPRILSLDEETRQGIK
jgi:5-methylcytosine-specific restriction endonuclease McrBC regulatory subunit McrC